MRTKWTYEMLKEEALKYNTRISFQNGSCGAYHKALRCNLLDDICSHMTKQFIWTDEMLKEEALKYNTRVDFKNRKNKAYSAAQRKGIIDDICSHMIRVGNIYNRFIYIIEFENNSVYIGLTCDLERRKLEHMTKSSNKHVNKFIKDNIKYTFNSDNILYSSDDSIKAECSLIEEYNERGYNVLNISKGGELGGSNNKWTTESIKEEALKYNTRGSFQKGNRAAYQRAIKLGILDNVCSHMICKLIYWSDEMLKEEALKYYTRNDFKNGSGGAYRASLRRDVLYNICSHMKK